MKTLQNPIFWALILFAGGMVLGAWGWDKNESTIPARTHGAVTLIVVGCTMIVAGLVIFFKEGNRK